MRGATGAAALLSAAIHYFNPRSSCEERPSGAASSSATKDFNPRSSCEERLKGRITPVNAMISIHAPHARSDQDVYRNGQRQAISIHAPHARSDYDATYCRLSKTISIHAPHARSDSPFGSSCCSTDAFQSTLLMRGATRHRLAAVADCRFQSTLLMRGATIYLHWSAGHYFQFQSTLLMRGATQAGYMPSRYSRISIHAPHARSDPRARRASRAPSCHFNPRSSCEERPAALPQAG